MALFTEPVLVFQQITTTVSNDFAIRDADGGIVGRVETQGSLGSLLVKGGRHFIISDGDGQPVLVVRDPVNLVRDTFLLDNPDGTGIGQVRRRFAFLTPRLDVALASGEVMELKGNLMGWSFEFQVQGTTVATVSRRWSGLARGLLGRSTYVLTFDPDMPTDIKKATIGTMIALDLVRRKDSSS